MDRQQFFEQFGADKVKAVEVEGHTPLFVRKLSVAEASDLSRGEGESIEHARVLVLCLADEHGNRLLTDDDLDAARGLPLNPFVHVVNEAIAFNGIGEKKGG